MVRCRTDFGGISDEFPMDFSGGGGGPNAPGNDWGILVVEFLVRPYLGLLDVCFRLEIGRDCWEQDGIGRGRIGCSGARGPNPRRKSQQK